MASDETIRLFDAYFAALDETIRLFGDLGRDPGDTALEARAYAAKGRRTAILNELMARLRSRGIRSFSEGHARSFSRTNLDGRGSPS